MRSLFRLQALYSWIFFPFIGHVLMYKYIIRCLIPGIIFFPSVPSSSTRAVNLILKAILVTEQL